VVPAAVKARRSPRPKPHQALAAEDGRLLHAVWYLRQVQQGEEGRRPSDVEADYGLTSHQQWKKLQAIREELRSDLRAIGRSGRG
jgi:hypothetical protein